MLSTRPRRSTSAVSYTESEASEVRCHLDELRSILADRDVTIFSPVVERVIERLQILRHVISDHAKPQKIQDAFRNLKGFQISVDLLGTAPLLLSTIKQSASIPDSVLILVQNIFALLSAGLRNHWGNRKYFRTRVKEGGWQAVGNTLRIYLEKCRGFKDSSRSTREGLFGTLVSFSLEDEGIVDVFRKLGREIQGNQESLNTIGDLEARSEHTLRKILGKSSFVYNPESLLILLELWSSTIPWSSSPSDGPSVSTPTVLRIIAQSTTHNLAALHEAGLLSKVLPLLQDKSVPPPHLVQLQSLSIVLLELGIGHLDDAHFLYKNALSSNYVAETLRRALKDSCTPPFMHFDLTLHGYASVELPSLGSTFPPPSSCPGYTLSVWLQVIDFDPNSHTTIFGAFDSTQSCFVLVYLEKDTRNLVLQTSVTSSRPSVRFKSYVFEASKWYHVCIIHRRPKATSSSRASLFVDGEFIEQVKAHYPSHPPLSSSAGDADVLSPGRKHKAVQAFLGTPQDLATKLGSNVVFSKWRLASAHLLNDALSDDLIAVHKELGPRYYGNYQDCLGSFQTYEASAALNLRNENLHPGKEEKSDIVAAVRSRACALIPESKYLLNISPMTVLDDNDQNNIDETQLMKSISRTAARNLRQATRGGRITIATNGAVPAFNEALLHNYGLALLTGNLAVVIPQSLDDAAWRIGGCTPIGLMLVEAARTGEDLIRALEIVFAVIKNSWRNSEAMERENGFSILANLLSAKLKKFTGLPRSSAELSEINSDHEAEDLPLQVLLLILDFIGYHRESPQDSVINNPLAYRILLVDFDMWRSSSSKVQELYYDQFRTFGVCSKHHLFNSKRLARMRKLPSSFRIAFALTLGRYHQEVARSPQM